MAKANVFISHRWDYDNEYKKIVEKFKENDFAFLDYSVPAHDSLDVKKVAEIKAALKEQVRQCNYFIIFARMAMDNSDWCKYEVQCAKDYGKPILSVKPVGYTGNIPKFIQDADNENGPVGFNTPSIIKKINDKIK